MARSISTVQENAWMQISKGDKKLASIGVEPVLTSWSSRPLLIANTGKKAWRRIDYFLVSVNATVSSLECLAHALHAWWLYFVGVALFYALAKLSESPTLKLSTQKLRCKPNGNFAKVTSQGMTRVEEMWLERRLSLSLRMFVQIHISVDKI